MTAPAWGKVERERLLGRIFLLHLLNETLERPSENSINEADIQDGTAAARVLSLRRERELVEILAFLSASTDDPGKVTALCVEERQNGNAMLVRMAVNNGGLENARGGFERMARILERVATQGGRTLSEDSEETLLREIVILNRNRILSRLRSRHASLRCNWKRDKRKRPSMLPRIAEAVSRAKKADIPSLPGTVLDDLEGNVRLSQTLFERLEAMKKSDAESEIGLRLLIETVKVARAMSLKDTLGNILRSSRLDLATVTTLTTPITKLGRYSAGASFLVKAAQELSCFKSIEISVIQLPPIPGPLIAEPETFVTAALNGIFDASEISNAAEITRTRLKQKYSRIPTVEDVISDISTTKFVVHAEIQLLFYYELYPAVLAPRLICSSKKACFLCNLFVKLHGKFIIPSSHGKLYEKWTLPQRINELQGTQAQLTMTVMNRFNDAVGAELRLEIQTHRRPYPSPLESAIFPSAVWSSPRRSQTTSPSTVSPATSSAKTPSPLQDQPSGSRDSHRNIRDAQADVVTPIYQCSDHTSEDTLKRVRSSIPHSKESLMDSPRVAEGSKDALAEKSTLISQKYIPLTRGEFLEEELSGAREFLRVATPRIHLTLSLELWKESMISLVPGRNASEHHKRCRMKVRWLEEDDIPDRTGGEYFVNLDAFPKGAQVTFNEGVGNPGFHIGRGSDIISVEYLTI